MIYVKTDELKPGMRLAKPIYDRKGTLLYDRNEKITRQGIESVKNFGLIGLYILEPAEPVPPMSEEEIEFEHSDNCVYVDIESLFIPIKGKLLPTDRAYYALKQLISEYDRTGEYVNVCTAAKVLEFFLVLAMSSLDRIEPSTGRMASERWYSYCERIDEYIEKNYAQPITMTTISSLLMLHENYISRVYKRIRGITIMQHLLDVRIDKAKKLLMTNRYSVAEISKMVGFRSQRYFITTFKRIERVTPGKYYDLQLKQRVYTYDPPEFIDPE